ncbi:DUF5995 family protein [Nocardia sp. NPDC050412]|uniref:DUF5995 family protein n=1 Tax=Nocardia sp. NPDC050412 TaxID=3364320 RepID=UPI0037BBC921
MVRIARLVWTTVLALAVVVSVSGPVSADPAPPAQHDDSPGSRLLLAVAGLPPVQALLQITRQLFGPDGTYLPWAYQLAPLPIPHTPTVNECPSGQVSCVDEVIAELERRAAVMRATCDDNAPFLLTYLDITKAERHTAGSVGGFADPAYLNNEDVHFADYYFHAIDNYYHGHRNSVPEAWQYNFRTSDAHSVTVLGSAVLAYNAHITRDLPYTIADLGVTAPDGASRKPDSERVSAMLTAAEPQVLEKLTALYGDSDPTLAAGLGVEPMVFMSVGQMMQIWREYAWRAAEQLLLAPTPQQRGLISAQIEGVSNLLAEIAARLFARDDPQPHLGNCPRAPG